MGEFTTYINFNLIISTIIQGIIMFWRVWLILLVIIGIKVLFSIKLDVHSIDGLLDYLFLKISHGKEHEPREDKYYNGKFPNSFTWISTSEYKFGDIGIFAFREGKNYGLDIFQILTEAEGSNVRVLKIAHLINKNAEYTRIVLNRLAKRLKGNKDLSKYISIVSNNEGEYRLAVDKAVS